MKLLNGEKIEQVITLPTMLIDRDSRGNPQEERAALTSRSSRRRRS